MYTIYIVYMYTIYIVYIYYIYIYTICILYIYYIYTLYIYTIYIYTIHIYIYYIYTIIYTDDQFALKSITTGTEEAKVIRGAVEELKKKLQDRDGASPLVHSGSFWLIIVNNGW